MRVVISLLCLILLQFCSKSKSEDANIVSEKSIEEPVHAGLRLIEKSDCQTCHHNTNQLIGPSYTSIATKYVKNDSNTSLLATKIIAGGSGVWGETPMNAHPAVSEAEAKIMVDYILSIDK